MFPILKNKITKDLLLRTYEGLLWFSPDTGDPDYPIYILYSKRATSKIVKLAVQFQSDDDDIISDNMKDRPIIDMK